MSGDAERFEQELTRLAALNKELVREYTEAISWAKEKIEELKGFEQFAERQLPKCQRAAEQAELVLRMLRQAQADRQGADWWKRGDDPFEDLDFGAGGGE